jgi:hypothetical protein
VLLRSTLNARYPRLKVLLGFSLHCSHRPLVFGVQLISGVLLLASLFVPLATILLEGCYANILMFHIAMQPGGIAHGLIVSIAVKTVLPGTQCRV